MPIDVCVPARLETLKMLPHAIYYDTLASIADESSEDWKATVAGLFVLRLVDDWLDFGPHIVTTDVSGLGAVCESVERISEKNPVRVLLQKIVTAIQDAEGACISAIAPSILAYAQSLEYDANFVLEEDVLTTLHRYATAADDKPLVIRTSLRLGIVTRHSGRLDVAEQYHQSAQDQAYIIGDTASALTARLGYAKTISVRGDIGRADLLCAGVVEDAEKSGIAYVHGQALHDRAYMSYLRGDYQGLVRFAYCALEHVNNQRSRDRILADIASGFLQLGHFVAARDTNLILSSCAEEQWVRWQATINLMDSAVKEWQEDIFELYRAALGCADLPPRLDIYYRFVAGYGYRIFGDSERAQEYLKQAKTIAERYGMQQLVFELEEEQELLKKPVGHWAPDIDVIAQSIGEQRQFYTLAMGQT